MGNNNSDSNEFTYLFDGQSIDGWCMAGPGKFVLVEYGKSLQSEGGMGLLWYTKKKYKDFVLKIDWKVSRTNDNSGIFIRFSNPDNDPWIAVNTGYEIQIDDMAMPDGNPLHKTGAIYNFAAPSNANASKPVGQWNTFEIEATGQKYSVTLNDVKAIPEFTGNKLTEGYIGIQNHDVDSHVSFKNIRIKEKKI
jgi:LEA14-like dessication related protein